MTGLLVGGFIIVGLLIADSCRKDLSEDYVIEVRIVEDEG